MEIGHLLIVRALPSVSAALCLSLLVACAGEPANDAEATVTQQAAPETADNAYADDLAAASDNAPDAPQEVVEGIFAGTLPCDGCEEMLAVDATLHLRPDGGFELIERQADGGETVEHAGVWYASDDGRAILLADDHGHGHRVFEWHGDDALRLLPDAPPLDDAEPVLLVRAD